MLDVWTAKSIVGAVDRHPTELGDYVFAYRAALEAGQDVSLTMPLSLESYAYKNGLHPVFQMNLPEGRLREAIERKFRKSMPGYDDLRLLEIVGRSQIGRLRFSNDPSVIDRVPLQSVHELVAYNGAEDILRDLLERFAGVSGVSGTQPKVLVKDSEDAKPSAAPARVTAKGATHIVKGWDAHDYPHLAANEFFCMKAAQRAGLEIPNITLSENNKFIVIERFDILPDGRYLGFEDFCSLNGLGSHEKYEGSYERVAKRIREFVSPEHRSQALETFFRSLAVSCVLRNGDAHLKNYGVLYETADKPVALAPAYDIVTTTPYIAGDSLALTLGGSKRFPDGKKLLDFAKLQCDLQPAKASRILHAIAEGVLATRDDLHRHYRDRPEFREIGAAMSRAWESGVDSTCKIDRPAKK
ncbi:MAG TPA: type II toxin-antitoxin system HipA family toxin [Rhodocyclaceae bacterium]|nr:type II toxin-antitoxin system HipA family toxin [Rhodocyclaceae bacterium]